MLDYVDDMLYFGTNETCLKDFCESLTSLIDIKYLGQAHWYLSTRISQGQDFTITIDQSRYSHSIVQRFLDVAGDKKVLKHHSCPLPQDCMPSIDDCSKSLEIVLKMQEEYNIDYASCIGALIYLSYTRPDIIFTVNKLAKFMKAPGKYHMQYLLHLL